MGVIARAVGVFLSPILHGFHCAFSVPFELVTASQVILYRVDSPDNATGTGKQVKRKLPYGLKHANLQPKNSTVTLSYRHATGYRPTLSDAIRRLETVRDVTKCI
jgi:hypothetical protein